MNTFFSLASLAVLLFAVSDVSGECCGRGDGGYCNDCSIVGVSYHRKCCGTGSGNGNGCNIICCGCSNCRTGHPIITYSSGWFFKKKYTCMQNQKDTESLDLSSLQDTWNAFNKIDQNADASISPDEFLETMRARLSDDENAHIVASHLLDSDNAKEVVSFLDTVNKEEMEEDEEKDVVRMLAKEFKKLDADGDGLIQAEEFDDDLKAGKTSKKQMADDDSEQNKLDLVRELLSNLE